MNAKLLVGLLVVSVFNILSADKRHYVWTYEYKTVAPGEGEIETYYTSSAPDIQNREGNVTVDQQLELEVGMTEKFDFAIYSSYIQEPDSSLKFKGYKLRGRYKLGRKNQFMMDPLLYLEYKGKPGFSEHGIETKLVISKDFGKLNISLNPTLEFEKEHGEWEAEFEYAVGVSYKIIDILSIGLEAKGSEYGHYIGPVIAHGSEHLWVALGTAMAISPTPASKPRFQVRLLLGLGL